MSDPTAALGQLMAVIEDRKRERPARSYTTMLLSGGIEGIGRKVCEEAGEVVKAASVPGNDRGPAVVQEAADLIYHLLVLLAYCDLSLSDVEAELARRFGVSGMDEKASRGGADHMGPSVADSQ